MAQIIQTKKALAVNPLKVSQTVGAALAFLGMNRSLPLMHGSQGCTAFGKVFFVRHFREPIPLQTTAMDQVSTIMGADENIVEALATLAEKSAPALIGLVTTGLAETQGCDILRAVKEFRQRYPQHQQMAIVPVNTPDYLGCFESGFALAVERMIDELVPASRKAGRRSKQVNVLASSALTPGDIEAIREWVEAFDLKAVVLPDLGDSLDGHLVPAEFSALTLGGTRVEELAAMGESVATLVIGESMFMAADRLAERTGVPDVRFSGLMGLDDCDALTQSLSEISGREVPFRLERQRAQLQDAMVDCHFMLGMARIAVAGDPDLLVQMTRFIHGMGGEVVAAVSPARADSLAKLPLDQVLVGDLSDLEQAARSAGVQLLIGSSHACETARRLNVPLLRAGFPQYDYVGGYTRTWVGYRGTRQTLFDFSNLLLEQHHAIQAPPSFYRVPDPVGMSSGWPAGRQACGGATPATGVVH